MNLFPALIYLSPCFICTMVSPGMRLPNSSTENKILFHRRVLSILLIFQGSFFYSIIHFWGLIQIEIHFILSKEIFSGFRRTFKIVNQKYFMCLFISGSSDKELSFIITKLWANKSSSLSICFVCFVSVENQKRKF